MATDRAQTDEARGGPSSGGDHAVAIVGIGCRFPGGVVDVASFWQLLKEGRDAITEIPASRIDIDRLFDPRPATPGHVVTRRGGFVDGIEAFDAAFFGISPREAERLDPQQRLLLETAWEALEDAGADVSRLEGSRTGVYVGQWMSDFESRLFADTDKIDFLMSTGSGRYAASGRLSYALGLRGPSLTLDTACSSSLVAVHLASRALRNGDCELALAGGVNLILQPYIHLAYSQSRMMAPDGHCKFGDASGDGYVRSEGAGIVVLKRLAQALADGDRIYAVVRGSATNNDGRSSGVLGRPSRIGHEELLRAAYADAGVPPARVGYVEAHGTGTRAGDPVEIGALGAVLGEGREAGATCLVGSVKTNIGHTESAAGVAGLIKAALVLHRGEVPASLHFNDPNPQVPWAQLPFRVPASTVAWPASTSREPPRVAGVNSFGISGTNAHAVLEAAPAVPSPAPASQHLDDAHGPRHFPTRPALLVLSARSPEALRELASRYARRVAGLPRDRLDDLCWAAATRRTPLSHRAAFVADDAAGLAAQLTAHAAGEAAAAEGQVGDAVPAAPVFIVPGQGGQWVGMARDLLAHEPAFRAALEACDAAAAPHLGGSIVAQLALDAEAPGYRLDRIEFIQPTLVALAIAQARWLQSVGIAPGALVGHSMGEVGAAHLAGVLDLAEAMRIICRRSALMSRTRGQGGMAMVGLSMHETERRLAGMPGRTEKLSVAASNSPASSVVSGEPRSLDEFITELEAAGHFARRVQVDVASHSPQMDGPAAALTAELAGLAPREATLPIQSTVLGRAAAGSEFDAAYWGRNMRQPVRFDACVAALLDGGATCFVELGPHPVLCGSVQQTAEARSETDAAAAPATAVTAVACGRRDEPGAMGLMTVVGRLWAQGCALDWTALLPRARSHVDLPLYPWQRERHWCEAANQMASAGAAAAASAGHGRRGAHPLLARRFDLAGQEAVCWETTLDAAHFAYLADHVVRGSPLFPAAAYCEAALAAAQESRPGHRFGLRDVEFHAAWALPDAAGKPAEKVAEMGHKPVARLQVRLDWTGAKAARFEIHGLTSAVPLPNSGPATEDAGEERWLRRASGRIVAIEDEAARTAGPVAAPPGQPATQALLRDDIYAQLARVGLAYGPAFRGLASLEPDPAGGGICAEIALDAATLDRTAAQHLAYPPLLDALLQVQAAALALADSKEGTGAGSEAGTSTATPIPVRIGALDVHAPLPPQGRYQVRLRATTDMVAEADLFDEDGRCLATLRASAFERLSRGGGARDATLDELLFAPAWVPATMPDVKTAEAAAASAGPVVIVADVELGTQAEQWLAEFAARGIAATLLPAHELAAAGAGERLAQALAAPASLAQPASAAARGHVVHLGALGCPAADAGLDWIERSWQRIGDDTLALARQVAALEGVAAPRLWLLTRGAMRTGHASEASASLAHATPAQAALWGLGRVWAHEQPALDVTLVDIDIDVAGPAALAPLLAAPPAERQLARRGDRWLALRVQRQPLEPHLVGGAKAPGFEAALAVAGTPDSLHWRSALRPAPQAHEVEIEVEHAGLNFMNLMSVLGILPGYQGGHGPLGIECSGRIARLGSAVSGLAVGDAVVAVGHHCLQRHAVVAADLVAPRPKALDSASAGGVPIAFLTAAYGLSHLARLERGERVLIHSAAGGTGLAALQVARHAGAEIFATAGSEDKRALLRSMGVAQVFDSRSLRFADEVLAATAGRGVDVVLNSLAGEAIAEGLRCLAPYGRFVELGKRDIYGGTAIALAPFRANLSYFAIDLDRMMRERPAVLGRLLRELMAGFESDTYQALPVRTYAADELAAAFRDLMPGTHVGKHVVALAPPPARVLVAPGQRMPVHAEGCYVVTGGLGALGLEVARWLAARGAGALMLVGRSAPGPEVSAALAQIAAQGTRVLTAACDVADPASLAAVLERARREGGPLRGVFHAAGVLADATLGAMTGPTLRAPRDAKVMGAWNLHRLTAADALDAFVLFSSVASLFGTPGQGNYAAANAFLDALAAQRQAAGRPALAINLGPVAGVGLAAASGVRGDSLARIGFDGLPAARVVEAIDVLVAAGAPQAACAVFDARRWHEATAREGALGLVPPEAMPADDAAGAGASAAAEVALPAALGAVPAGPPRRALLEEAIKSEVGAVLRMATSRVPADRALKTLGLDSLMALELRNRLEKRCGIALSPTLAWNHPTVRALAVHLAERLRIALDAAAAPAAPATPAGAANSAASASAPAHDDLDALLDDLDQMTEEEARALLEHEAKGAA
ncbi:MAG: type I polyketide synthase [Burkholderiales bacterium]|nr:type I polyketide synthase [Burkholderiales bacterium]